MNNDKNNKSFFCFEKTVKEGWENLVNNYENIKEIELKFEEKEANFKTRKK